MTMYPSHMNRRTSGLSSAPPEQEPDPMTPARMIEIAALLDVACFCTPPADRETAMLYALAANELRVYANGQALRLVRICDRITRLEQGCAEGAD